MEITNVRMEEIVPYEKNSKKHPQGQIDMLKNIIKRFGYRVPILLDKNNVIIAGHGRYLAMKELQEETIPAIYIEDLSPAQIRALRIADNKANESAWNYVVLQEELSFLNKDDLEIIGFHPEDIVQLQIGEIKKPSNDEQAEWVYRYELIFDDKEDYQEFLNRLNTIKSMYDDTFTTSLLKFLKERLK